MFFESPSFSLKITLAAGYWLCEWCSSSSSNNNHTRVLICIFASARPLGERVENVRVAGKLKILFTVDNYLKQWLTGWLPELFQLCRSARLFQSLTAV
jgi:hypothetical protein